MLDEGPSEAVRNMYALESLTWVFIGYDRDLAGHEMPPAPGRARYDIMCMNCAQVVVHHCIYVERAVCDHIDLMHTRLARSKHTCPPPLHRL